MINAVSTMLGIFIMLIIYVVTMLSYFWVRQKFAGLKYKVEISFIFFAIALSIAIKVWVLEEVTPFAFTSNLVAVLYAIYSGIGGLTFEGIATLTGGSNLINILYMGSSLYAGLIALSIITAKANYEIYCWFRMLILKTKLNCGIKMDIYIFTAVTEDALILAKSIVKEHKSKTEVSESTGTSEIKSKRRYAIIFAGNELEAYERKNPLHREVMSAGFLFWSYTQVEKVKNKKSIARSLNLNNENANDYNVHYKIFAFSEKDGIPNEEVNMDLVYSDIRSRLEHDDNLRIDYYILTKRDVNYQAYEYQNRELLLKYWKENPGMLGRSIGTDEDEKKHYAGLENYVLSSSFDQKVSRKNDAGNQYEKINKSIKTECAKKFLINVVNEANIIAKQATQIAVDVLKDYIIDSGENGEGSDKMSDLLIWSLGFGQTSQAIIKEMYIQTSYVNKKGISRGVKVEAFDNKMSEESGLFQYENPLFACVNYDTLEYNELNDANIYLKRQSDERISSVFEKENLKNSEAIISLCKPLFLKYSRNIAGYNEQLAVKSRYIAMIGDKLDYPSEMSFPLVCFNTVSCLDNNFFKQIDNVTGNINRMERAESVIRKISEMAEKDKNEFEKSGNTLKAERCGRVSTFSKGINDEERIVIPKVFIIATGDDFRNIQLANAFIQDICNENFLCKESKNQESKNQESKNVEKQLMIVNIKDSRNMSLLISTNSKWKNGILESGNLVVAIVGCSENIYSYDSIININQVKDYIFGYDCIKDSFEKASPAEPESFENISRSIIDVLKNEGKSAVSKNDNVQMNAENWFYGAHCLLKGFFDKNYTSTEDSKKLLSCSILCGNRFFENIIKNNRGVEDVFLGRLKNKFKDSEELWYKCDIWLRKSNESAKNFKTMLNYIYEKQVDNLKENFTFNLAWLAMIEHQRWSRLHIANGWTYKELKGGKRELLKQHGCIVPYVYVPESTVRYDVVNVIWAIDKLKKII